MAENVSPEDKKKFEEQKKQYEAMQRKQYEEQKKLKKIQLNMTLKQLEVNRKLVECTIERLKSECEVVEKIEMAEEKNKIKKNALRAKLAEMNALLDNEMLKLEMIDFNTENVKAQLENIDKIPPGMMGRQF